MALLLQGGWSLAVPCPPQGHPEERRTRPPERLPAELWGWPLRKPAPRSPRKGRVSPRGLLLKGEWFSLSRDGQATSRGDGDPGGRGCAGNPHSGELPAASPGSSQKFG